MGRSKSHRKTGPERTLSRAERKRRARQAARDREAVELATPRTFSTPVGETRT